MIAIGWINHHRTFRYIERYDGTLVALNMALLLEVAVIPFILNLYSTYSAAQLAIVLFAATQAVTELTMALLGASPATATASSIRNWTTRWFATARPGDSSLRSSSSRRSERRSTA